MHGLSLLRLYLRVLFAVSAVIIMAILGGKASYASGNPQQERQIMQVKDIQIRDIGAPVHSVNWVRTHIGRDSENQPCLCVTMGQQADGLFVLQIDPKTGKFRQFVSKVPNANYPTATLMSRTNLLYIGAAYAGHLLRFDPEKSSLEDLGAINAGAASFPCRIDEDKDGIIWIGSYGTADLNSYDSKTGKFTHYGRMDDVDMYNYPLVNFDGKIACLIRMTKPHVVMLDPKTGEKKPVGPITTKGKDTIDLRRGKDGKLYIVSSKGNFVIEGMNASQVDSVPDPMPTYAKLPDGVKYKFVGPRDQAYRKLAITDPDGKSRTFDLDYEASGSDIFYVHEGPDGKIYGSSILPLHLFRYDPKTDELVDLGVCSQSGGEAYSMVNLDGKLYICSYPGARISVYDPAKPYHMGSQPDDNPRDLGRIDDISYRPRSALAGPLGSVWLASIPDYGRWGGPLSYYNPATEEKKAYYRICGDASCYTLAYLPKEELIAVGTSISGGSGTRPKVDQAVLFLWDYRSEKKAWEGALDRPVSTINALLTGTDGKLYGTVIGGGKPAEIFRFDPDTREFEKRVPVPGDHPLDLGLQNGPDGKVYGFTRSCIYVLDPESMSSKVLVKGSFGIAGPIVGKSIYFASGHILKAARIFE